MPNEDMSDYMPAVPMRKGKKTWITDVNIYSKKKKDDNMMADDDDPMDEYGKNAVNICSSQKLTLYHEFCIANVYLENG